MLRDRFKSLNYHIGFCFCLAVVSFGCSGTSAVSMPLIPSGNSSSDSGRKATISVPESSALRDGDWFRDITNRTRIDWTYQNGRAANRYFMIESFGGGAGIVDFDRDGRVDLLMTGGGDISEKVSQPVISGRSSALFRNHGDWLFENVSIVAGFKVPDGYSQGIAVADFDADGFPDLFIGGYGGSYFYRNRGDGTYSRVEAWGSFDANNWVTAAAFADFDHDGLPDLMIARYADWSPETNVNCATRGVRDLCGPTSYQGTTCLAYRNSGNGLFEDWSTQLGLCGPVHGLAVVAADLNLDGLVDFYIASDVTPNQLYLGSTQLPLQERGVAAGVAFNEWGQAEGSMGVDVADFDGDGRPDIVVTNFEREDNALYRSLDHGTYLHSSAAVGLSGVSRMNVGFGTAMTDFDGDGWPDLFVANGNPIYEVAESPYEQKSQLFRNIGGRFVDVSEHGGSFFREAHSARGSAVADFDDDGALDIVVVPMNEPVRILRNRHAPQNFIRIQLAARNGEPDATGAVVFTSFEGRKLVKYAVRGTGFFSQSDSRILFPVERLSATAEVIVQWPARKRELFRGLAVRETHLLVEGRGESLSD